jgi:exosortase B
VSTVLGGPGFTEARSWRWPRVAAALGLAALYVPTYVSFARTVWRDDAYAHGPIILLVVAWLAWRERAALASSQPAPMLGALLLVPGLALYLVGRAFGLNVFEAASHLPVFAGLVVMAGGVPALRRLAFPIALLFFVIPLPGFLLDLATTPLKTWVSATVATILHVAGYPIERSGVVLDVGGHPMLVADACSGLNSIYSLVALSLVYAHVTPPRSRGRMLALLAAIIPIALVANIVRVTALVLLAYHFGDDVAQGFLHAFAGLMVFVIAMWLLVRVDSMVRGRVKPSRTEPLAPSAFRLPPSALFLASAFMLGTTIAVPLLKPTPSETNIDLERVFPQSFGEWRLDPDTVAVAPAPDVQASLDRIYRQVVSRTYVNAAGDRMMLTVAHGGDQGDALKAHRQEKCYEAQGFEISGLAHSKLAVAGRTIPVTRMVATRGERIEPVTYWFTMGDRVVLGRAERLREQIASGFAGRVPDGMLVRISSLSPDAASAFASQARFAETVFGNVSRVDAPRFIGRGAA